jgi:acyl-CoA dehydrogenase
MNDIEDNAQMVRDMVGRMLADNTTPAGTGAAQASGIDADAWRQFNELGLRGATEGIGVVEHCAVLQEIGYHAALVPYAESEMLGRWLAQAAGLDTGTRTLSVLVAARGSVTAGSAIELRLSGQSIAWGRHAQSVLVAAQLADCEVLVELDPQQLGLRAGANMAGEPLDLVDAPLIKGPIAQAHKLPAGTCDLVAQRGALARSAAMVGALAKTHELALQYARDRKQFGKSLSEFQVIQAYLATNAAEVCAASVSLDAALVAAQVQAGFADVACAKVRVGQAVRVVCGLAHQIHGAIGMTHEYPLHYWTRRLWSWREEWGGETYWARRLGDALVADGGDAFWPHMTERHMDLHEAAR